MIALFVLGCVFAYTSTGAMVGASIVRKLDNRDGWVHPLPVLGAMFWPLVLPMLVGVRVDSLLQEHKEQKKLPKAKVNK